MACYARLLAASCRRLAECRIVFLSFFLCFTLVRSFAVLSRFLAFHCVALISLLYRASTCWLVLYPFLRLSRLLRDIGKVLLLGGTSVQVQAAEVPGEFHLRTLDSQKKSGIRQSRRRFSQFGNWRNAAAHNKHDTVIKIQLSERKVCFANCDLCLWLRRFIGRCFILLRPQKRTF